MKKDRDNKGRFKKDCKAGSGRGKTKTDGLSDHDFFDEIDSLLIKRQKSKNESISLKAIQHRMKLKEMREKSRPEQEIQRNFEATTELKDYMQYLSVKDDYIKTGICPICKRVVESES